MQLEHRYLSHKHSSKARKDLSYSPLEQGSKFHYEATSKSL